MVLTITVVGNGQANNNNNNNGHAVLSPNELAQLMSYQTVTGLLNPDGSITLNPNVMSTQQLTSMPANMQNENATITSTTGSNYPPQIASNSISNLQQTNETTASPAPPANTNHSQTTQKKPGQKRQTAKQKLARQQQQQQQQQQLQQQQQPQQQLQQHQLQQQVQSSDPRNTINNDQSDQSTNQQPQIVATVQLPNGQIGQLIAPSGGQFWSPNAINLQQLSMAVAAATGSMPQTMSIPVSSSNQPDQQMGSPSLQQQSMPTSGQMQAGVTQQQQQQQQQQQSSSQSLTNQAQMMTPMLLPNNQMGQVVGRQGQNQMGMQWSGGPISLSQLSALAQQGVVQLSSVQGIPSTGPNGQRVVEMVPQPAVQGLVNQNGQPLQAISLSNGGQFITPDPNDPGKWQIVQSSQIQGGQQQQMANMQSTPSSMGVSINNSDTPVVSRASSSFGSGQYVNSSQNSILGDSAQSTQPQRKLKRLACTCPNCRDGDNGRNSGDKKKQHICHFPDCNKVYGKTSHLRAHLRWHSGERPYVCNWSFCGKKFTRSDELQRHRRTHTGEKRFQCSECLKRFMRSDHLSKHLKTHLSSKKGATIQETNGIPTIVSVNMSNEQIKIEKDMIDELALDSLNHSGKQQQQDHPDINVINNPS